VSNVLAGRRVLVVEDEVIISLDVGHELEMVGATCHCVSTLADALKLLTAHPYDAAVLDYRLPDGFSTELCEELERRGTPYLIHSGYEKIEGACALAEKVEKPMATDRLVDRIVQLILKPSSPSQPAPTVQP